MTYLMPIAYLFSSALFILGIKKLGSPATAPLGNRLASLGMLLAVIATLADQRVMNYQWIAIGIIIGSLIGGIAARMVKMTAMPQMVALFNGFGGGASALVAAGEYFRLNQAGQAIDCIGLIAIVLSVFIGCITFNGSMVAFAKLQGLIKGMPITFPLQKTFNALLAVSCVASAGYLIMHPGSVWVFVALTIFSLGLGKFLVFPIGGADMPVVISLLNSLSGVAAAVAGFIIMNHVLIISGALVGASGLLLTQIMCKAMNRSIGSVIFGSFGKASASGAGAEGDQDKTVRQVGAEEAAMVLAYAKSVVIVPGYGMAVAQAQHGVRELSDILESKGVDVKFGIHPVAGRMPGHMNVLLAEANVPYGQLYDMESINPEFPRTDVVLVIGANDVVNPAAKDSESSPIYGMPILEVDKANHVIVIKRSMNPGFAGIENQLFYNPKTMMLFGGAKDVMMTLVTETKAL